MTLLLLVFAGTLLFAVLVSGLAERTVLSTAVIFLLAGFASGGWLHADERAFVGPFAELALVTVLFTDALRIPIAELRKGWRLPGRALLLGLPLTVALNGAAAHWVVGIGWGPAFLAGAALAPTDPCSRRRSSAPRRCRRGCGISSTWRAGSTTAWRSSRPASPSRAPRPR